MEIVDRNGHNDSPTLSNLEPQSTRTAPLAILCWLKGHPRQVTRVIILLALRTESEQSVRRRYLRGCEHRSWHDHFQAQRNLHCFKHGGDLHDATNQRLGVV